MRTTGFLNPNIQILWGHAQRLLDPDPAARAFYTGVKLPAIAAMFGAAAALNYLITKAMSPPDDWEEIQKRMQERRDIDRLRYMVPLGAYRIPFDGGLMGGVASYGWNSVEEWLWDDPINGQEKALAILKRAGDIPGLDDAIPPLPKTMLEINIGARGYSFFRDKDIVPGFLVDDLPYNPEFRTLPSTPEFYNQTARLLANGGVRISPLKLQYLVETAFAREYDEVADAFDHLQKGKPLEPADLPEVGRLMQREPRGKSSESVRTIIDLDDEYKSLTTQIKKDRETDPQDPKLAAIAKRVLELEPAHHALLQIDKTYEEVKHWQREPGDHLKEVAAAERKMTAQAREFLSRYGSPDQKATMQEESIGRFTKGLRRKQPIQKGGESDQEFQKRMRLWDSSTRVPRAALPAGVGG